MQTKIEIPEGYEIDKVNSTFELIKFKKQKQNYPQKIEDVKDRQWFINQSGVPSQCFNNSEDINNMFTEKDCEEHLAFIQLDMLCQAYNKIDCFNTRIANDKYGFENFDNKIIIVKSISNLSLSFKDLETAEQFKEQFNNLLEKAKRLL